MQELVEQGVLVRTEVGAVLRDRPQEGARISASLQIPTTVQGVLAARIDRLAPDEKALLQQLSVIGREFPVSLIRQVVTQPEEELYRLLASLQRKEFLYEQPAFPEVEYIFKHALTQEVAYGTVLQEQRKLLHEQHRPSGGSAVYRDPPGALRRLSPSLPSQCQHRESHSLSPLGGTTGCAAVGQHRGNHPLDHRSGVASDLAGHH